MKHFILSFFLIATVGTAKSQFSESFFNSLLVNSSNSKILNRVGCTEVSNGFFGVVLADSAGTSVQFINIKYNGAIQEVYGAALPTGYDDKQTSIVNTYFKNGSIYLVLSDITNGKVGIAKYVNYTLQSSISVPANLFNTFHIRYNSYWNEANNSIAVYVMSQNKELERYSFDVNNMQFVNSLTIASGFTLTGWGDYGYRYRNHIFIRPGNDEKICFVKNMVLYQASIANNTVNTVVLDTSCYILYGLYEENNIDVLVYKPSEASAISIVKRALTGNVLEPPFLSYQVSNLNTKSRFCRVNNKDVWRLNFSYNHKICIYDENGNYISGKNILTEAKIFKNCNNKLLIVGKSRRIVSNNLFSLDSSVVASPFISWNDPENILPLYEMYGNYDFGQFYFSAGTGLNLFVDPVHASPSLHLGDSARTPATIFTATHLVAGKDTNGHFRGNRSHIFNGNLIPGPYTNPQQYTQKDVSKYFKNFYVDVYMVGNHLQQVVSGNTNYIPPKGILNWPANGDPSRGQSASLAPFIDFNGNGIYEPLTGEFPDFPGTRCLLSVSHDPLMGANDTVNTGLEFFRYIYDYDCDDPAMKNTIFSRLVVKNRGNIAYDSLIIGVFSDMDIGGSIDDYMGSNVELGLMYTYNADSADEDNQISIGFGGHVPAQGFAVLKSAPLGADGIDNSVGIGNNQTVNGFGFDDGIVDNEYWGMESAIGIFRSDVGGAIPGVNDDPINTVQNFMALTARYKDHSHMVYGGTGHQSSAGSTNIPTNFVCPGNTDPLHYATNGVDPGFEWSEITNSNPKGDRRVICGGKPYPLMPNETLVFDGAFIYGLDADSTLFPPGVADLFVKTAQIRQYFQNGETPCGQPFGSNGNIAEYMELQQQQQKSTAYTIYPNPSNGKVFIRGLKGNEKVMVMDYSGRILQKEAQGNQIDLSTYSEGLYFIVISNQKSIKSFKVMKR